MQEFAEHLTLAQASGIVPGHPSPNCVWRWCRYGVKSRTGERIRLQHVRIGGMLYTTAEWVKQFGQRLAEADAQHFDVADEPSLCLPQRRRKRHSVQRERQAELDRIERELSEAGI